MHGGTNPGAPSGNQNAFKHGHYSAEATFERRFLRAFLRESRNLIRQIE
jgi:uncharacterized protein YjcR